MENKAQVQIEGNVSLEAILESLLLVSSEPVSAIELSRIVGISAHEVEESLYLLSCEYQEAKRGIQLLEVARGWRFYTNSDCNYYVSQYVSSWDTKKLSQAALETLAIVAYHQPITRDGIKAIRGVNSEGVLNSLIEKGFVKELGKSKDKRQAILYGTTVFFLEQFGIKDLSQLPDLEQFAPDEKSKHFIRERLSSVSASSVQELYFEENTQLSLDIEDGDSFNETGSNLSDDVDVTSFVDKIFEDIFSDDSE